MYLHPLPTTGAVSFADFVLANDLAPELAAATEARARLRDVLKDIKRQPDAATGDKAAAALAGKDWSKVVQAVDDYLPHLFAVHNCLQTDDLLLRVEPEFSWRTTLSPTLLRPPPRVTLRGLYYEIAFVLLLHAASLSNLAASVAHDLGPYEHDVRLDATERKARDTRLRFAADTLCRAAGVFSYLSDVVIPQWENVSGGGGRITGRPPDVTKEVTRALSNLAMAEAETLAIRKLLSPSLAMATDTITPGPPLPSGHPSPSLLCKLHLNAAQLYESAASLARSVSAKTSAGIAAGAAGASEAESLAGLQGGPRFASAATGEGSDDGWNPDLEQAKARARAAAAATSGRSSGSRFAKLKGALGGGGNRAAAGTSVGGETPGGALSSPSSPSLSSRGEGTEVASYLLRYLAASAALHRHVAYKWQAINEAEAKPSGNDAGGGGGASYGDAIGFLRLAREGLKAMGELKPPRAAVLGSSLGGDRALTATLGEPWEQLRQRRKEELANVEHWLLAYTKLNDTVAFQPIAKPSSLSAKVPTPRGGALGARRFEPPEPAFGPGSAEYVSAGMRRLGLAPATDDDDDDDGDDAEEQRQRGRGGDGGDGSGGGVGTLDIGRRPERGEGAEAFGRAGMAPAAGYVLFAPAGALGRAVGHSGGAGQGATAGKRTERGAGVGSGGGVAKARADYAGAGAYY